MTGAVNALSALLGLIARAVVGLAGVAIVALVVITGWMVYGRYVLNDTPTWVERGALLLILFVSLPVAAVGVRERFHMAVDFIVLALPRPLPAVLGVVADLVLLGFGLAMLWGGSVLAQQMWAFKIPLLGLSQGLQYLPMAIAGGLIVLFCFEHLLRRVVGLPPVHHVDVVLE